METFGKRLRRLREQLRPLMSQRSLAKEIGVSNAAVSKWEADLVDPNGMNDLYRKSLARVLKTSVNYLMTGKKDSDIGRGVTNTELLALPISASGSATHTRVPEYSNVRAASIGTNRLPVWGSAQAGIWAGKSPTQWGKEKFKHMLTDVEYSSRSFAVKIEDKSMDPAYQVGDVIIIDPEEQFEPGDMVAARVDSASVVFRKYKAAGLNDEREDYFILEPLNGDYKTLRSDMQSIEILGPEMEHRTYPKRKL